MLVYVVMYHDDSWGTTGDKILGVFDTLEQAKGLIKHVEDIKDFDVLGGSYPYIEELTMNCAAEDSYIMNLR